MFARPTKASRPGRRPLGRTAVGTAAAARCPGVRRLHRRTGLKSRPSIAEPNGGDRAHARRTAAAPRSVRASEAAGGHASLAEAAPGGALGRAVSADGRDCRGAARKRGSLRCACTLPPEGTGRTPVRRSQGPVRRAGCGRPGPGTGRCGTAPRHAPLRHPGDGRDQGIRGRACARIVSRWAPWTAACNSPRSNLSRTGRPVARLGIRTIRGPEQGPTAVSGVRTSGRRSSQVPDDAAHLAGVEVAGRVSVTHCFA